MSAPASTACAAAARWQALLDQAAAKVIKSSLGAANTHSAGSHSSSSSGSQWQGQGHDQGQGTPLPWHGWQGGVGLDRAGACESEQQQQLQREAERLSSAVDVRLSACYSYKVPEPSESRGPSRRTSDVGAFARGFVFALGGRLTCKPSIAGACSVCALSETDAPKVMNMASLFLLPSQPAGQQHPRIQRMGH